MPMEADRSRAAPALARGCGVGAASAQWRGHRQRGQTDEISVK